MSQAQVGMSDLSQGEGGVSWTGRRTTLPFLLASVRSHLQGC